MPETPVNVTLTEEVYYLLGGPAEFSITPLEQSNILRVDRYLNHAYHIISNGASVTISASLDGVTWFPLETADEDQFGQVNGFVRYVQAERADSSAPVKVIWASRSFYEG